ncbi:14-3-3-like protein [Amborella trichopoda]|uniref:14-3-3-like protein n=1 Tax=Amborella trichopoda TaxID=13333 RepID=UPI0005D375EA|nr:14-3-3-like protein [Amborella trichopoda]|eukprot:XP_006843941.2 14-3-3-like protein [Amborella trichopoda]
MADYMTTISCTTGHRPLNTMERNLLVLAFKSLVRPRRASWRKIKDIERVEDEPHCLATITDYLSRIESEIVSICERVQQLLDSYLITYEDSAEARGYYRQMKADYFRHLAEFKTDEQKKIEADKAQLNHEEAMRIAKAELRRANPTRLVTALNFTVEGDHDIEEAERRESQGNAFPLLFPLKYVAAIFKMKVTKWYLDLTLRVELTWWLGSGFEMDQGPEIALSGTRKLGQRLVWISPNSSEAEDRDFREEKEKKMNNKSSEGYGGEVVGKSAVIEATGGAVAVAWFFQHKK